MKAKVSTRFLVLHAVRGNLSWVLATTPTGSLLPEFLWTIKTSLESLPILTYVFLLFVFFYAKISSIIGISVLFHFSTIMFAIIFEHLF